LSRRDKQKPQHPLARQLPRDDHGCVATLGLILIVAVFPSRSPRYTREVYAGEAAMAAAKFDAAKAFLAKRLRALNATGAGGFEGLMRDVLTELTSRSPVRRAARTSERSRRTPSASD
jgi:hypothetical protein